MPVGVYIRIKKWKLSQETKDKIRNFQKGRKRSEKTKKKMSEAKKGIKISEETRKKLSESHKGKIPWIKGKKHSKESKRKMSESQKRKPNRYWLGKKHSEETKRKLSIAHKGKLVGDDNPSKREDVRKKISAKAKGIPRPQTRGEKSPHWKGGITPINEKIRKSIEYKFWRKTVFERDNYTCVLCKKYGVKLNADHIKRFSDYPEFRFDIDNGRTLCEPCHRKTDTWGRKKYQPNHYQNVKELAKL